MFEVVYNNSVLRLSPQTLQNTVFFIQKIFPLTS